MADAPVSSGDPLQPDEPERPGEVRGPVSVVLADDQALMRMGFRMVLEAEEDITVVGEASDGTSALAQARALHPDVILMDVRMPGMNGIEATERIAQEALTNVLRYAPTTPAVSVDVERHIGTVVLTVDNEAAPGTRPMHGSGKGLIGMRERASVYGGTVQAGPTPTGWRVRAVLRWDEHDEGTFSWQTPL